MSIELSVIIPVYNVEKYIRICLSSVLKQVNDKCELIIVNDGSPDSSINIIDEIVKNCRYDNIKVITQSNRGLSGARNTGIRASKGRYISFLDSDDVFLDNAIEKILSEIEKGQDVDLIEFDAYGMKDTDDENFLFDYPINVTGGEKVNSIDSSTVILDVFNRSCWFAWARVYKRELFNYGMFVEGRNFEDILLIPTLYIHSKKISKINEPLIGYRINSQGITRKPKLKDLHDIDYAISICEHLTIGDLELAKILFVTTLKGRFIIGYNYGGIFYSLRETRKLKKKYNEKYKVKFHDASLGFKNGFFYTSPFVYHYSFCIYHALKKIKNKIMS